MTVFNPIEALGIIPGSDQDEKEADRVLELWGPDPVQPSSEAYKIAGQQAGGKG